MPDSIGGVAYAVNICQCGHDLAIHTNPGSFGGGTCQACAAVTGHGLHAFTSDDEIAPATVFPQTLPARFVSPPFPTPVNPPNRTTSLTAAPGSTTITFSAALVGVVPGMVVTLFGGVLAPLNYLIVAILAGNQIQIAAPGLFLNVPSGSIGSFDSSDGSTVGGNTPANGQRGG